MSGDSPRISESCDALYECEPAEMDEIAESIEDVLGIPRPMVARCSGTGAMGGGVTVDGLPLSLAVATGSETLLKGAFNGLGFCSVLGQRLVMASVCICRKTAYLYLFAEVTENFGSSES